MMKCLERAHDIESGKLFAFEGWMWEKSCLHYNFHNIKNRDWSVCLYVFILNCVCSMVHRCTREGKETKDGPWSPYSKIQCGRYSSLTFIKDILFKGIFPWEIIPPRWESRSESAVWEWEKLEGQENGNRTNELLNRGGKYPGKINRLSRWPDIKRKWENPRKQGGKNVSPFKAEGTKGFQFAGKTASAFLNFTLPLQQPAKREQEVFGWEVEKCSH